jgi:hypothetical protein
MPLQSLLSLPRISLEKILNKQITQEGIINSGKGISFCTFSKNRLYQVKKSIPHLLSVMGSNDQLVYVDYDDPNNSKEYVKSLRDPRIKIIWVKDAPWWQMNHARNCACVNADKELLVVMDIDNLINPDITPKIRELDSNNFILIGHGQKGFSGFCALHKKNFLTVNGYEEAIVGYGRDEDSLYGALINLGLNKIQLNNYPPVLLKGNGKTLETIGDCSWSHQNGLLLQVLRQRNPIKNNVSRNWGKGWVRYF